MPFYYRGSAYSRVEGGTSKKLSETMSHPIHTLEIDQLPFIAKNPRGMNNTRNAYGGMNICLATCAVLQGDISSWVLWSQLRSMYVDNSQHPWALGAVNQDSRVLVGSSDLRLVHTFANSPFSFQVHFLEWYFSVVVLYSEKGEIPWKVTCLV
jgi:hypothetical protein